MVTPPSLMQPRVLGTERGLLCASWGGGAPRGILGTKEDPKQSTAGGGQEQAGALSIWGQPCRGSWGTLGQGLRGPGGGATAGRPCPLPLLVCVGVLEP